MDMNKYITLREAAEICPGTPNAATVWRWCRKGVKTASGPRIKLVHIRAGAKMYTTREHIEAYFAQIAAADAAHFD